MTVHTGQYRARIGSQDVDLPLVAVGPEAAISLFMTIDRGVALLERAGRELADLIGPLQPEIVATNATLGIPVAIEVTRALGLDDYLVLQKTPKIHLGDALTEPLTSITTGTPQLLRLDRARCGAVEGRRVVVVDDVIASGASIAAALRLLRRASAEVVGVGSLLVEGDAWRAPLGDDAALVRSLGSIPSFRRVEGGWAEEAP